ncbi:MAG: hypothetical protein Q9160_006523 [Pyrenula sp. 1 TL-2023]
MAAIQIPTVTLVNEDLAAFHQSHFKRSVNRETLSTAFSSAQLGTRVENASHEYLEEQDLGYYEDGVKRTLTDDQIAMFRHSEIQRLLLERRLRLEAQQSYDSDDYLDGDSKALASDEEHSNERSESLAPMHGNTDAIDKTSGSLTESIQANDRIASTSHNNNKKRVLENKEVNLDSKAKAIAATTTQPDQMERHLLVYDDV